MDIDAENCTLTVVGTVDPVAIVLGLKKACLAASIIGVEDDKPKEPDTKSKPEPEPVKKSDEDDPCHCVVEACDCEKVCVPGCYCCYYGAFRPAPYGYGWHW
jgi:hypothetical protein